MVRKIVKNVFLVLLFFGSIAGIGVIKDLFHREPVVYPDYSDMQRQAEYFMTLYLDWSEPLDQRKEKMSQIAPEVGQYLVSGQQSINFVSAGTPYYSMNRGFVDVTAMVTIPLSVKKEEGKQANKQEVDEDKQLLMKSRVYSGTVFFVRQEDGSYRIDSVPTLSLKKVDAAKVETVDASQQAVIDMLKPQLSLFIPAFLSGEMLSVQNLLLPESEISTYKNEYVLQNIEHIRVRPAVSGKIGEYVVDVTITVKDKELNQPVTMLLNFLVRQEETKFFVLRAVS